jgi:hypothetical protein
MKEQLAGRGQRTEANHSTRQGIFGRRAAGHFRTLEDGRRVFYPMGSLGRLGYVLHSVDQELVLANRIQEGWKTSMVVTWIVSMVFALSRIGRLSYDWGYGQWLLVFGGLWLLSWAQAHLAHRRLTRSMERTRLPNTTLAHWRNVGRMASPAFLVLQGGILIGLVGLGFHLFVIEARAMGFVMVASLGIPLVSWAVSVHSWWKMRTDMKKRGF